MINLCALIFAISAGAVAQLLMKAGLHDNTIWFQNWRLAAGLGCYASAMGAWIVALRKYELNFAYPLLSIGYVLVYIGAYYWPEIGETITWNKTMGLSLIILGVVISAQQQFGTRVSDAKNIQT